MGRTVHFTLLFAALALLGGCAAPPAERAATDAAKPQQVSRFSSHAPGDALPPGWRPWLLSAFKRPTRYRMVHHEGRTVVRADAQSSASGLVHPLALDPGASPLLSWQWKVDQLIAGADNTQQHLEDAPVRLVVSFDGDNTRLSVQERLFFDNIRLLTGQQLPYATLMYIWENRAPRDTVIPNRHTSRIRMIVAESGTDRLGRWQTFTRNVAEDFRRAFGEAPGKIIGVGLMTDTDNTGSEATAWYGDIVFGSAGNPPVTASAD
jgi:hypothetical protein